MTCPRCRSENREGALRCDGCGASLAYTPPHLARTVLTSRSALEGERKQVTVLFCDLAGSTTLVERIGPDAMHTVLDRFFQLAAGEIHRYEGTINQFLGDGFMALFGAPLAHEDHARQAVLAAMAIQRALAASDVEGDAPAAVPLLRPRFGLNTGLVVIGRIGDDLRMDYTAIGDTTNVAARLQQVAEPGTVVLSESTWRGVRDDVECRALGARTLKGRVEPIEVYQAVGVRARPAASREAGTASPLVGRDADVAAVLDRLDCLPGGRGSVIALVGEAGIGKDAGADVSWACLHDRVRRLAPDGVADVLPYLGTVMGLEVPDELGRRVRHLDGQAMKRQIFLASRRFFERLAWESASGRPSRGIPARCMPS